MRIWIVLACLFACRLSLVGSTGILILLTPGGHPPHPSFNLDSPCGCLQFSSGFFVGHFENVHCHTVFYVCRHFVSSIHHSLWVEPLPYVQPRGLLPDIQGVCCHSCHSHLSFTCWCKPNRFVHIVRSLQNFEGLSHVQLMSSLLQCAKSEFWICNLYFNSFFCWWSRAIITLSLQIYLSPWVISKTFLLIFSLTLRYLPSFLWFPTMYWVR
jgi:hypothetical protein